MSGERHQPDASALLDALFEHGRMGIVAFDADLRLQRVNVPLARVLGVDPDAAVGRRISELAGPAGEATEAVLRGVLERGETVCDRVVRVTLPSAPDEEREFETTYFPVCDAEGAVVGVVGTVVELTRQREVEAERDRLLKEALVARAQAEAAQVRAEGAQRDAERARGRTALIAEAGARMASVLDLERGLAEVARVAVPAVADWCVISLADRHDGSLRPVATAHADPGRAALVAQLAGRRPIAPGDDEGLAAVVQSGRPRLHHTVDDEDLRRLASDDEELELLRRAGVRSSVIVPLKTAGRRIGTLVLVSGDSGRRYGDEDVALARALAARAALHAENARLYAERSHIAETLQDALLPEDLPEIPGVDLAVRYRASGDQNQVGGDFYDVFRTGERSWTAVVGDVSGKGAEAAVVTSLTRHTLYAGALRDHDPVANLMLLNEAVLRRSSPPSRFCTVVTAALEPRGDGSVAVTLANGGHPPPFVVRAGGAVDETTAHGTVIGAMHHPRLIPEDLVLQAGDLLLLYTDGVTELRTDDPGEGLRRLRGVLERTAGRTAAEVVEAVEADVLAATAGEPRDDVALLAVRVVPALAA